MAHPKTKAERKAHIINQINKGCDGKRTIMEDNIMDMDTLAEETIRIEDLLYQFKNDCISAELLESTLARADKGFNTPQLVQSMITLVQCIEHLDKMDEAISNAIPAMATINAVIRKQNELLDLKEAIS